MSCLWLATVGTQCWPGWTLLGLVPLLGPPDVLEAPTATERAGVVSGSLRRPGRAGPDSPPREGSRAARSARATDFKSGSWPERLPFAHLRDARIKAAYRRAGRAESLARGSSRVRTAHEGRLRSSEPGGAALRSAPTGRPDHRQAQPSGARAAAAVMVSWILCRAVVLVFGMLYPAYASYKAVKTKNIREYVRWMMYWIVFALFMATETIADTFISWFPFYYEIKMAFVVWLLSPYTRGASLLYRKFIHPTLSRREKEIDLLILQAKDRGYETLVSFGKKSLNVAATAAVQAAAKSQGALAGRLRSFSMQDLRSIPDTALVHYSDPLYLEEQALRRRPIGHRAAAQRLDSDSSEDCWSDSELSAGARGRSKEPVPSKPLARSQSLRVVKKPPVKEGSARLLRSHPRKKVADQDR